MDVRLLGPFEAYADGRPLPLGGRKQRALLALLALHGGRTLSTARLVEELWGEDAPETAAKMVQIYVSQLRKALPPDTLVTRPPGYLLRVNGESVDVARSERLLAAGREALARGEPQEAAGSLRAALELWRGPSLAEFAAEPFARAEIPRLEELHVATVEERLEADLALGRHAEVAGELEALAARHPLRERLQRQLVLALYRCGRQAEALAAYQAHRRLLDEELGLEPSAALRELERRILRQDPALEAPVRPEGAPDAAGVAAPSWFVGRDSELDVLHGALEAAAAGSRRLVVVSGEAGVGKSALVDAFLAEAGRENGLLVARGQAVEQGGAGEAYLPVLDALGRLARTADGEVLPLLRRRAPTWLAELPRLVGSADVEALQQRTLGATRERMLREMLEALEELTSERPLVLVLEDLQWGDPSTVDLLGALARRDEPARLLVVGTYRPEESARAASAVEESAQELRLRGRCIELRLGPLGGPAVAALVAARATADVDPRLAVLVHERSGGNPLFAETVLDEWLADGAPPADLDELAGRVPESLRQLVEQRLQRLDAADLELLEAASVAGGEFAAAAVAAVLEQPEDEVERRAAALARTGGLLQERSVAEWPDGTVSGRFAFAHTVHQQLLYERIPAGVRARFHQRLAERGELAYADRAPEIAGELAHHFVLGRCTGRALSHLRAAAEHALRLSAHAEALAYVRTGLEIAASTGPAVERARAELPFRLLEGSLLVATRSWSSADAERAFVRALELAEELGEPGELATTLYRLATLHEIRGEYDRSEELLARALDLPDRAGGAGLVAESHELMACSLFHQADFGGALEHADSGLGADDGTGGDAVLAAYGGSPSVGCHGWAGLALWFLGRPEQAAERAREAIALAADDRRRHSRAGALAQAAMLAQLRGEPAEARAWADQAIESATTNGYTYRTAMGLVLRGWARALGGEEREGLDELQMGLALSRETGGRMDDAYYLGLLADACLQAGRDDEAEAALDEALALVESSRAFFYEAELHRLAGELALRRRDEGGARERFERALAIARRDGARALELRAALALARSAAPGDRAAATALERAVGWFREGVDTPDLAAARRYLVEHGGGGVAAARPNGGGVRYARSGDLSIAFEVTGLDGPDLVLVPGFVSHLQKDWQEPRHARFLDRLGSFSRLIRFDKRGTGLSDRPGGTPDLEARMDDVRAVMDAAGSERAVVLGYSEGGPMAILFAATYPERVESLVLYGAYATRVRRDDYPWAATAEERRAYADRIEREWGWEADLQRMCPTADVELARWWGERARAAASPGAARALVEMNSQIDVRELLPALRVPTLVIHRTGDVDVAVEEARYLAARIPSARLVELPGVDHFVAVDPDAILDVVEPFVRGRPQVPSAPTADDGPGQRVLATILVTDLPHAAREIERLGDRGWAELRRRHDEAVRDELRRHSGEDVDNAGEGFVATFDGPGRAIRCAVNVRERLAELGLVVRIGLHTGEIVRCPQDVRGIAVHTAARVAAQAEPGEVLVTATTRDLVAGSGLAFDDRGERSLKGLDGARRLFAVAA